MKFIPTFLFCLFQTILFAQDFALPVIDSVGNSIGDFAPKGWSIVDTTYGDLNKDKVEDVVLVLQSNDTIKEYLYNPETKKNDDLTDDISRILVILFKNKKDGKYQLIQQNNQFMLRPQEGGMMGDPFVEPITIEKNTINISFEGGTSQKWRGIYRFRFQQNDFYLIGAESVVFHSVVGTFESHSYNFLTKKVKTEKCENIFDEASKTITEWKTFPVNELKTLKALVRPFLWEVVPGDHL